MLPIRIFGLSKLAGTKILLPFIFLSLLPSPLQPATEPDDLEGDAAFEKKLVATRKAVIMKLDQCTHWRDQVEKTEKEQIERLLMMGKFEECRDLVLKIARNHFPDSAACIKSVTVLIKKYRRALEEKFRKFTFEKSKIEDFLSTEQLQKLHELLQSTNRSDMVEIALQRYFGDLSPEKRETLVKEFFAYKVELRRKPRSVKDETTEGVEGAKEKATARNPNPLKEECLGWQTRGQKEVVRRLRASSASEWDILNLIADQFYHAKRSLRKRYQESFINYCNENLRLLIGDENFEKIKKMYNESEKVDRLSAKFQQLVGEMQNETDRLTADHYGVVCRKFYRLLPFQADDLTSWLTAQQKLRIGLMIIDPDINDAQVYDQLYEWFSATKGTQKEEADEIIISGCRNFIALMFGDDVAEETEDMRLAGNVSAQHIVARLAEKLADIPRTANRKQAEDSLSICKRIYLNYNGSCHCNGHATVCDSQLHSCLDCQNNTAGYECDRCKDGYLRQTDGACLQEESEPQECNCHSHSQRCRSNTCEACNHNTTGDDCGLCLPGFFGDATRGTQEDCVPCPCPKGSECTVSEENVVTCSTCPENHTGLNCEIESETEVTTKEKQKDAMSTEESSFLVHPLVLRNIGLYRTLSDMNQLAEMTVDGGQSSTDESSDFVMLLVICGICGIILGVAIKLCYNYSRTFPGQKESETVQGFNRRAISVKGSRGNRYSVA
ncbi:unnamed protein product [Caenorhabditis auriculariae]|uniref:Laminin EGF-like domain-containing protein n=1 Tax=Caenorhabditis auriculariae TaxID=2777116 RepID=A0A8S1HK57_9PELO|nr:unnamed protein product [Caenorhabditis auriculariae]